MDSRAQGETGAVCARRARTRRPCLGADAPKGLSAGTDSGGSSAYGTSSKMMRRLVPEKATDEIIGSPGGATGYLSLLPLSRSHGPIRELFCV